MHEGRNPLVDRRIAVSAAFEGCTAIAEARAMARDFLVSLQTVHGLPVSDRAMGMVQLVVSELVTNARKYAPGSEGGLTRARPGNHSDALWSGAGVRTTASASVWSLMFDCCDTVFISWNA
jgi:hypothetical protein